MSELKPGRELDILIAEKVMGYEKVGSNWAKKIFNENGTFDLVYVNLKPYSTSIGCAWEVLNKFPRWTLERNGKGKYICLIPAERIFLYVSSTAPMAICLAALNASGHVFEESKK